MGVLCTCTQAIIYSRQKNDIEINPKITNNKNISNKATNFKSKYKEKHLTKDSTLVNYNNNNSPDNHESNKNNLSELEPQSNSNKKEKKQNNKNSNSNDKNKNENIITQKETFDKENQSKKKSNIINNIHVISPNIFSPNSLKNIAKPKKVEKFLKLNPTGEGKNGDKNLIGFRADSFNFVENPIKNILTNKSNNITKNDPKKNFISNKTIDGTNKQDEKNFKLSFSIKTNATVFGQKNQKLLWYYLHKHFMIMEYNDEFINYLMDYINILKYSNKEMIFKKGEKANNFYIIKQGIVMLSSNGKIFKKLNTGNTFGEISLFQQENNDNNESFINNNHTLVRNYTAISYGKTELFVIRNSSYNIAIKAFSSKLKTIDYNDNDIQNELKEKNREIIENYEFFKYLDSSKINLIVKMAKTFSFKENGTLLSISNYNKRVMNPLLPKKPFFRSMQCLIFPIQGELIEITENLSYMKKINKYNSSGIIPILYPKIKNQIYTKINQEDTKILYIPEEILIEVLGPNYPREILKPYFLHHFFEQKILSIFLNINLDNNNTNK